MDSVNYASDNDDDAFENTNGQVNGNTSGQRLLAVGSRRTGGTPDVSKSLPNNRGSGRVNRSEGLFINHQRAEQQELASTPQVQAVQNPVYVNTDIKVEPTDPSAVESGDGSSSSSDESSVLVPFSFRALSRKRKLLLISLCLGELCSNVMLSIMAPFFPSEALAKGVSSTVSGWIFGVLPLAQVIFSPLVGAMMKPVGVKFLFLSGAFLGGCATVLFGALDHMPSRDGGLMFIIYCFAIRITTAWGFASYTTAAFVIIAQEFGDNVSQVFGIAETFCGIGAVLGPAVGGVLYGWGGFGMPFFVLGSVYLLTVPLCWSLLPSDAASHRGQVSSFTLLRVPGILVMCWTVIVLAVVWSIFEPVLEPRLSSFNLSPQIIGLVFLLTAASYALSAPLFGFITERINDLNPLVLVSLAGCTACLALLGPSPLFTNNAPDSSTGSLALIIVSLVLLGMFNSMGVVPSYEYMLDAAEEAGFPDDVSVHGAIGGLWGSSYAFGEFLGPITGGFLLDISSFGWTTTAGAGFSLISMTLFLVFVLIQRYRKRMNRRTAVSAAAAATVDAVAAAAAAAGAATEAATLVQPVPFRRRSVSFLRATSLLQRGHQQRQRSVQAGAADGCLTPSSDVGGYRHRLLHSSAGRQRHASLNPRRRDRDRRRRCDDASLGIVDGGGGGGGASPATPSPPRPPLPQALTPTLAEEASRRRQRQLQNGGDHDDYNNERSPLLSHGAGDRDKRRGSW